MKTKKVHQERPMFSRRTACGRRIKKGTLFAWGTLKLITCDVCWKKAAYG